LVAKEKDSLISLLQRGYCFIIHRAYGTKRKKRGCGGKLKQRNIINSISTSVVFANIILILISTKNNG